MEVESKSGSDAPLENLREVFDSEEIYWILEFQGKCRGIVTEGNYIKLISEELGPLLNLEYFAHSLIYSQDMPDLKEGSEYFFISTYPPAWQLRYIEKNYGAVDPTNLVAMRNMNRVFSWHEIYQIHPPDEKFIQEAASLGLEKGVIIGTISPTPPLNRSIFSFAGVDATAKNRRLVELLIPDLHTALEKVASLAHTTLLTPTEKKVLALQEKRFSRDQMASQLNVSRGDINFHLGNIFKKLGAGNAPNAVYLRFRQGIIVDEL